MAVYSKETALFDTGAIGNAIDNAENTAKSYISFKSGVGLMVADMTNSGPVEPDSSDLDTNNTPNTLTTTDSYKIRRGRSDLAAFRYGSSTPEHQSTYGTMIESYSGNIALVPKASTGKTAIRVFDYYGQPFVNFNGINNFTPNPRAVARSTNSNISLASGTITKVPLTNISFDEHNVFGSNSEYHLFSISDGNVKYFGFDAVSVEITASVYIQPAANAGCYVHLYYKNGQLGTTTEIASTGSMMITTGGSIQLSPRIVSPVYSNDEFYIAVRVVGTTGTARPNHIDTQMQIKLI